MDREKIHRTNPSFANSNVDGSGRIVLASLIIFRDGFCFDRPNSVDGRRIQMII